LFVFILGIWIASPLLSFSHPILTYDLIWVYLACLLVLSILFLRALLRFWSRWKEVTIFLVIWAIVLLPYYRLSYVLDAPVAWLSTIAFRIHSSPIEQYLARCDWVRFSENGTEQSVGECERFGVGNEDAVAVVYDSTGEIMLPVSQRTPEWTAAMMHFESADTLTKSEGRAAHLSGNFYNFFLSGSDD
jgi:hypothetical protein